MELNYSRFWFTLLVATGVVFISIAIIFTFQIALGFNYNQPDSIDPRYVCFYEFQYPYYELCQEQRENEFMNKLLNGSESLNNDEP